MDASRLREKVHHLVDKSNEDLLQSVYQLLEESEYTDEFKNILNEEQADYQKGKVVLSKEEMEMLIEQALKR